MNNHFLELTQYFNALESVVIAFSGGVDSTLLMVAAYEVLGDNSVAVTVKAPYIPAWEINEAEIFSKSLGLRHEIIELSVPDTIMNNPPDRCYLCKKQLFTAIKYCADTNGIQHIADGSNHDDLSDYRPGLKALKELQILSPFKELGITKSEIREMSKERSLPTAHKPAYACLLTRIPYDTNIKNFDFSILEEAELILHRTGFKHSRVRWNEKYVSIEVPAYDIVGLTEQSVRDQILSEFTGLGIENIMIDLRGYRTGSMNETILKGKG